MSENRVLIDEMIPFGKVEYEELKAKLLEPVNRNDFYTDGMLDIEKAARLGKLYQVQSFTCDEAGKVINIGLRGDFSGYVYLMRAENGLVKIGRSENPHKRLSEINGSSPIAVGLIFSKFVENASAIEQMLHEYFSIRRQRGEWFDLETSEIRQAIKLLDEVQDIYNR